MNSVHASDLLCATSSIVSYPSKNIWLDEIRVVEITYARILVFLLMFVSSFLFTFAKSCVGQGIGVGDAESEIFVLLFVPKQLRQSCVVRILTSLDKPKAELIERFSENLKAEKKMNESRDASDTKNG